MTETDDSLPRTAPEPPYLATPALRQRIDLLGHLLEFGHQMVVLQGESGSGRSRLLGAVAEHAKPNWRVIPCDGARASTGAGLLAALSEALELGELDAGVEDLRARLAEIELGGQLCVLTLDNAEHLDEGARAMLFALGYSEHQRGDLRVAMAGDADSDFGERLQLGAPPGAVVHVVDLPPLEIEELKTLALSVLPAAGEESPLDEGLDLDALAVAAEGNPGRLLASLRRAVPRPIHPGKRAAAAARAMGGALRGFNVRKYTAVLAAAAFVLVAVAIGVVLMSRHAENSKPGTVEITLPAPAEGAAADAASPATATAPDPAPATEIPASPAVATQNAEPETATETAPPVATAGPPAAPAPVADAPEPAATIPTKTPAPAAVAAAAATAAAVAAATAPADKAPEPPAKHLSSKPATKPASERPTSAKHAGKSVADKAPVAKVGATKAATPVKEDPGTSFYSSSWVKLQKPGTYVVQLFGSRDRAATTRFIRDHGIGEKATVVEVKLKQAPWYIVVSGLYTSRAAANAAIRAMPSTLANQKPWPRAVNTLQ